MPQAKKQKIFPSTKAKIILTIAICCYILLLLYLGAQFINDNLSIIDLSYLSLLELLPCLLAAYIIANILLTVGVHYKKFLFITVLVLHFVIGSILFYTLTNDFLIFIGISLFYVQFPLPVLIFIICVVSLEKRNK